MANLELNSFAHRFVPAPNAESAPTLLLLHGTGGSENDLLELGRALSPNANLLSPRGRVLEGQMPRWFARLREGVFDEDDLKLRVKELVVWLEIAARNYEFDEAQVLAVGYSNGANIAGGLLLLHPQVLEGAILLHPMVPLIPEKLPDLRAKSVFIGAGKRDPLVTVSQTQDLIKLLEKSGAHVQTFWDEGGHNISSDEFAAAKKWFEEMDGI